MSTSLLVEAIKKEAAARALPCEVESTALHLLEGRIAEASCVLVAPQVRHRLQSVQELGTRHGKPVAAIEPQAYGRIDGKAILDQALSLARPA